MVQGIKVFRQVHCYRMGVSLLCILLYLLNGILRTFPRAITVAVLREQRLVDRCKALCYSLLENAVFYCWNTKLSYSAVWRESPLVLPGRGIFPPFNSPDKLFLVSLRYAPISSTVIPSIPGAPLFAFTLLKALLGCPSQYLLQEFRLCTVPFLPYPAERTVRSHIPFTFRAISLRAAVFVFYTQDSFLLSRLY